MFKRKTDGCVMALAVAALLTFNQQTGETKNMQKIYRRSIFSELICESAVVFPPLCWSAVTPLSGQASRWTMTSTSTTIPSPRRRRCLRRSSCGRRPVSPWASGCSSARGSTSAPSSRSTTSGGSSPSVGRQGGPH